VHIDNEVPPILDQVVLFYFPNEHHIPPIHVGVSKYYMTHIKWYHIYLHFINVVFIYENFDTTLLSYSNIYINIYLSQWVWARVVMNFQSNITLQYLDLDMEEFSHPIFFLWMETI
jgi:hypothetical protein